MKRSARNRIIAWSVVSAVLIAILVIGIGGMQSPFNFSGLKILSFGDDAIFYNNKEFTGGDAEFGSGTVKNIIIYWNSGNVKIEEYDGYNIEVSESSSSEINSENVMQHYLSDEGTLIVKANKRMNTFFGWTVSNSKNLAVKIPKDKSLDRLQVSTASADISVSNITANETDAETASGSITLSEIGGNKADINTVSGTIDIKSESIDKVSAETVSGNCNIYSNCRDLSVTSVSGRIDAELEDETSIAHIMQGETKVVDIESVSGAINLVIPESIRGFTADYDSVSGVFECDFKGRNKDECFIYGDGSAEFNFETVSGSIKIESKN